MKIYNNVPELVGGTPLVRLNKIVSGVRARIVVTLESRNPFSSAKDRIGLAMIEDAHKGYRCVLCMPESFSVERRRLLKALGAELVLTPASRGSGPASFPRSSTAGSSTR